MDSYQKIKYNRLKYVEYRIKGDFMEMTEMNKDAFKEFAKIVLFCCNYSERKVYIRHLKIMLCYYFTKENQIKDRMSKLINFNVSNDNVEIMHFDDYIAVMKKIGFVDIDKNIYGSIVFAKKRLEDNAYDAYQLELLHDTVRKSIEELKDYLDINVPYSHPDKQEEKI